MANDRCLIDAAQYRQFEKLVADSAVDSKGDQLVVNCDRLQKAITQGLAFINPTWGLHNELMDALKRLPVAITIEAVCGRRNPSTGGIEVLLTKLWDIAPSFPALWRCPRTTKQPGESDDQALDRIGQALGANLTNRKQFCSSTTSDVPGHQRRFYRCEVAYGAKGTWFPVTGLPIMDMTRLEIALYIRSVTTA